MPMLAHLMTRWCRDDLVETVKRGAFEESTATPAFARSGEPLERLPDERVVTDTDFVRSSTARAAVRASPESRCATTDTFYLSRRSSDQSREGLLRPFRR
jgi:hypothetical protein